MWSAQRTAGRAAHRPRPVGLEHRPRNLRRAHPGGRVTPRLGVGSLEELAAVVRDRINYYNQVRRHSSLGDRPPLRVQLLGGTSP
ncbi:integrase core domain-containing protein [Candidatus Palauibacter sp.]|uniref:integrase core domain-containing protein n=1 Tax=Candidatus Palauibacter sp. TaxID=3101350 RepID=UPI003B51EF63